MKAPPGWDIPLEIRARLGDRSGRQRVFDADGHIVMVLHRVPQPKTHDREGVFFWRTPAGEWHSSSRGQPLGQLKKLIEEYQQAVDELGVLHLFQPTLLSLCRIVFPNARETFGRRSGSVGRPATTRFRTTRGWARRRSEWGWGGRRC